MAEGRYTRIKSRFWVSTRKWNDETKFLALYLLTSPHNNILGCYVLPKLYICADLGWDEKKLAGPFDALITDGFIKYDEDNTLLLISKYLPHNPIENSNQAQGAIKILKEIPSSPLLVDLKQLLIELGKPFLKQLIEALGERNGKPVTVTVAATVTTTTTPLPPTTAEEDFDPAKIELEDNRRRSLQAFEKEFGRLLSPMESQSIIDWADKQGADLVIHALKTAVIQGNRTIKYIGAILENWHQANIRSVFEVEEHEAKRKQEKAKVANIQEKARQPDKKPVSTLYNYETFVPPGG